MRKTTSSLDKGNALILLLLSPIVAFATTPAQSTSLSSESRGTEGEGLIHLAMDLDRKVEFNIPAQNLDAALLQFSKQTRIQVIVSGDIRNQATKGISGKRKIKKALTELLEPAGLNYRIASDDVITVAKPENTALNMGEGNKGKLRLAQAENTGDARNNSAESTVENSSEAPAGAKESLQEVVVTGTHIRGAAPEFSPVTIYGREKIEKMGVTTVTELLRKVPQNYALIDGETTTNNGNSRQALANGFQGTSINLNGLGAGSTLVLLNGHRLPSAGSDGSFVDVSMIPLSAIERVEILSDGASAIYGADAVAGVVNFVLRERLDGAETSLNYGDTTSGGGETRGISQTLGTSWSLGNALLAYEYTKQDPVDAAQRSFIPPQGGTFFLLPEQSQHSGILTGRQALGERITLSAEITGAHREFASDSALANGLQLSHTVGSATQAGAGLTLDIGLPRQWHASISGSYGQDKQKYESDASVAGFEYSSSANLKSQLTSAAIQSDGPLTNAPGGVVRGSIGVEWRREQFSDLEPIVGSFGSGLNRRVIGSYVELRVPIIGEGNRRPGFDCVEVSLAGRHDSYEKFGSATTPKFGVLWAIKPGFNLRGSFGKSFRAPPIANLSSSGQIISVGSFPDENSSSRFTAVLSPVTPQNPDLTPERSRSFTAGFDIRPQETAGLQLSATYFDVRYTDRIAAPPFTDFSIFDEPALASFITRSPTIDQINDFLSNAELVSNFEDIALPEGVQAIFDQRLQNIAKTHQSGIQSSASYDFQTRVGILGLGLSANYLLHSLDTPAISSSSVELAGRVFNPARLRARGDILWSRKNLSAGFSLSYVNGYVNNLAEPVSPVASWTTADAQVEYAVNSESALSLLSDTRLSLSVQNITNKAPPKVNIELPNTANLGYDATNASAQGRFIAFRLRKSW